MKTCHWVPLRKIAPPLVALLFFHQVPHGVAGTLLVSNTNDSGAGSLRQAIADNASLGGGNTIIFQGSLTGSITLGSRLMISTDVTILGPGPQVLTLSGNHVTRVFLITSGNILISGLTVANGRDSTLGNGIAQPAGSLMLSNCVITNCTNASNGGGIYSGASLLVVGCTICNNLGYNGGGLSISGGNTAILNSTICSNTSTGSFSGGGGGGGIYFAGGTLSISNSTLFANSCISTGFGGGILTGSSGTLNIASSTITSNSCDFGNGGGILKSVGSVSAFVVNTIIAKNLAPGHLADCGGTFTSGGYNLIGQTNGSSGWSTSLQDQFGNTASPLDPMLGPLQSNGGPTPTAALLPGSPATDKGNSFGLTIDQRGAPRPFDFGWLINAPGGDGSDIGAFESGSPVLKIQSAPDNTVVLSWPSCYGDFGLECSDALPASNGWNSVTNTPLLIGNQFSVTNVVSDAGRFYRLKAL